jgi:hypothetical protein
LRRTLLAGSWATCLSADKRLGHCRDQAEIVPRLIDATAHRHEQAFYMETALADDQAIWRLAAMYWE